VKQPDLFSVEKSKSPLALYIEKCGIHAHYTQGHGDEEFDPWIAWEGESGFDGAMDLLNRHGGDVFGYGKTKIEAIYNYAKMHQVEGWDKIVWDE